MEIEINQSLKVIVEATTNSYAEEKIYLQWHEQVKEGNEWVFNADKPHAQIAVITDYTAFCNANLANQNSIIEDFINDKYNV